MSFKVESCEPHCVAWARASAALWGMSSDHDLDEPVRLSTEVPVRLRYERRYQRFQVITDRDLSFKMERPGSYIAVRFTFKDGSFREIEAEPSTLSLDETLHVKLR